MLRTFFAVNGRLCDAIERHLPQAGDDVHSLYVARATECLRARPGLVAADVGGGRKCDYATDHDSSSGSRIIAVDVSPGELSLNRDVDARLLGDASRSLPFAAGALDMITACRLLEHLPDPGPFVSECRRVLRPGGFLILFLPARFAPFALLKQMLPGRLMTRVIRFIYYPESEQFCWSPLYYRACYPSALERLLRRHGFALQEMQVSYYQSRHFRACVLFYALSALYELMVYALRLRNLASYVTVVATRTG
jgi:SAM-dependent methyltransferase